MRYSIGFIIFLLFSCQVTKPDFVSQPKEIIPLSSFENSNLEVAVALFDMKYEKWYFYNEKQLKTRYSPASTFKIPNSIIGLQTREVKSIDEIWNWDSIVRQNEHWNKDHSMSLAFKNSTVWYYQKLAKIIGKKRMTHYLNKFNYGNQQIGDSVHQFWLNGNLLVSPLEQLSFLHKLKSKKLDLREEVYDQLKKNYVCRKFRMSEPVREDRLGF
ncbi:MAG: penicillin-binding transpeptidase domain-containing protein [Crocinitomicaceae bacterium]